MRRTEGTLLANLSTNVFRSIFIVNNISWKGSKHYVKFCFFLIQEDGFKQCGTNCKLCPFTGEAATTRGRLVKSVKVSNTGEDYVIRGRITCSTKNVLYLATCTKADRTCPDKPQYGGETGQEAKKRFAEHYGTITQPCHVNTTTPVGQHFRQLGHSVKDLDFIPVERIYSSYVFVRKARERHLINRLGLIDNGLNRRL